MKINRLETHDRLNHFIKDQSNNIFLGAEECLKKNPDALAIQQKCPYVYIYAHARTDEDGVTKRMLWQARMSKPTPQTNSYLFRAISNTDIIEVIWILPSREMWPQFQKGKVTENDLIQLCIDKFQYAREELERPHEDDLPELKIREFFVDILRDSKAKKVKPKT